MSTIVVFAIVLAVALVLAAVVAFVLWRRRDASRQAPARKGLLATTAARETTSNLRALRSGEGVGGAVARFLGLRPDPLEEVRRLLVLGEPESGKKSLIDATGLRPPATAPAAAGRFAWTGLLGDGLAVIPEGGLVIGTLDKPADTDSYKGVLSALRRDRPTRPLDAIVVVVPAPELFPPPEDEAETRREARVGKAMQLRSRLEAAQSALGVNPPVYLVVSKCDRIPGFDAFVAEASTGVAGRDDLLQTMLGWSSPESSNDEARGLELLAGEVLSSIDGGLAELQRRRLMSKEKVQSGEALFGFPHALMELDRGLSDYLQTVLAPSALAEPWLLRGVYLTGDGRSSAPAREPAPGSAAAAAPRAILFARDLFTRKIFPERGLCDLTLAARRRREWQYWALMAVAVLPFLLLWGAVALTTERRVARAEDTDILLDRVHAQLDPSQPSSADGCEPGVGQYYLSPATDPAPQVLGAFQNAEIQPLTTWLLPTSKLPTHSLGTVDDRVAEVVFQAYQRAVLPGFKRWLGCRGKALLKPAPEPPEHDIGRPFAVAPEVTSLRAWAGLLQGLGERNQDFDDLVRKESIRDGKGGLDWARSRALLEEQERLAKYLFDFDVPPGDLEDLQDYLEAMARAKEPGVVVPSRSDQIELADGAGPRARAGVEVLYRRMFDENEALAAVRAVVEPLSALESGTGDVSEELRTLRGALIEAERVLAAPGLAWVAEHDFQSVSEVTAILQLMRVTGPLGQAVAAEHTAEGKRRFDALKLALADASTRITGPVLARDEKGNLRLALSPFLAALRKLLEQGFMTVEGDTALPAALDSERVVWNTGVLTETAALVKAYDAFAASETFAGFPREIRSEMGKLARRGLESSLLAGVKRAAESGDKVDPLSATALGDDVKNLALAGPPLREILAGLEKIGAGSGHDQVRAVARGQSSRLLEWARRILDSDSAYLPRGGSFAFWQGDGKPVYRAFSVKEGDDGALGDYADTQREHIAAFQAEIAAPVLGFAESPEVGGDDSSVAGLGYFRATRKAFDEAAAKKAGNAIDELQGLLGATLPRVTLPTCLEVLDKVISVRGRSFFQGRHSRLRSSLRQRCEDLASDELTTDYGKLRRQFDRTAASRFPFAAALVRDEAAPDAVRSLLGLAAEVRARHRASLAARGDADEVVTFLDAMDRVRAFLGPMWEKAERAEDGFLDVEATFRTNREQELAANRIAEWTLEIGADRLVSGGERTVARWHVGDGLKLHLRWAKTSPDVPTAEQPPYFRVRDRTAILEPPGQWALLRVLAGYEAKAGDLPGGAGSPHTLKLELHTEADPGAGWVDPAGATEPGLRVFMKLSVWAGAKEKLLRYPSFPTTVPLLPPEKR